MKRGIISLCVPLVVLGGFVATGCSDDEILGHSEEEPDPAGLTISITGQAGVTVVAGQVQGEITVTAGDETSNFDVVFTAADGDPITPDVTDFFLETQVADEGTAIFHATGDFRGHIEGVAVGTTTIVFRFMHPPGPEAHSNYDSPPIPITVNP